MSAERNAMLAQLPDLLPEEEKGYLFTALVHIRGKLTDQIIHTKADQYYKPRIAAAAKDVILLLAQHDKLPRDLGEFLRTRLIGFQFNQSTLALDFIGDAPQFEHDCNKCLFYGRVNNSHDLWYCPTAIPFPTMIVRHSSEGSDYESAPEPYSHGMVWGAWQIKNQLTKVM